MTRRLESEDADRKDPCGFPRTLAGRQVALRLLAATRRRRGTSSPTANTGRLTARVIGDRIRATTGEQRADLENALICDGIPSARRRTSGNSYGDRYRAANWSNARPSPETGDGDRARTGPEGGPFDDVRGRRAVGVVTEDERAPPASWRSSARANRSTCRRTTVAGRTVALYADLEGDRS